MRISDWSSDVCSSDLVGLLLVFLNLAPGVGTTGGASHRGYGLAGATTDLIAKQTTDHRTNGGTGDLVRVLRSEEHTSELQSLMRISYAVFCLKKKTSTKHKQYLQHTKRHNHIPHIKSTYKQNEVIT